MFINIYCQFKFAYIFLQCKCTCLNNLTVAKGFGSPNISRACHLKCKTINQIKKNKNFIDEIIYNWTKHEFILSH